jgi:triosephosphate isomerase
MIAGNWKMNTTVAEAIALVREMKPQLESLNNVECLLCPPFVSLTAVAELLKGSAIKLGAQNVYFEDKGAYTGEISPLMLAGLCQYVIIGHSERRQYFHDGEEIINKKIKAVARAGLKPILCFGENQEENESGKTGEVVRRQLRSALSGVDEVDGLVVAYEPIWAIGSGLAASGPQANDTIGLIRSNLANLYTSGVADEIRILYGGSVKPDNVAEYMGQSEIDGALVGGASLKADQFVAIARKAAELRMVK